MASNDNKSLGGDDRQTVAVTPASIEELEKAWWLAELEAESLYDCLMWIQKDGDGFATYRVYQKYKAALEVARKLHGDLLEQTKKNA